MTLLDVKIEQHANRTYELTARKFTQHDGFYATKMDVKVIAGRDVPFHVVLEELGKALADQFFTERGS